MVNTASCAPMPLTGVWGGDRVNLTLALENGQLDYDCAAGSIDVQVLPDSTGKFSVRGTHQQFQRGGDRVDHALKAQGASYEGRVVGDVLELRMRIDGDATTHSYRLEKNKKVKLLRCL